MKNYHIAVLPGDGVGPEVIAEGVKAMRALEKAVGGFTFDFEYYDMGVGYYLKSGSVLTDEVFEQCKAADAIYFGAVGMPAGHTKMVLDDHNVEVSGQAQFKLRFGLDLFAGVRPVATYPNVPPTLNGHEKIDLVLVRESTEGLFASYGGGVLLKDQVAADMQIITREGCEKVFNYAFQLAASRRGRLSDGRRVLTCVQKANVFRSFAFFKQVFHEVAAKYQAEVLEDYAMIDAVTMLLLKTPEMFDVIVSENAHGDILSDMLAGMVGGMGMAPSGDIGLQHAMFQPAHGTAPTIAGKNVVNPTAAILSARMMLEWLSARQEDPALRRAAEVLESSVRKTFENGVLTGDVGGVSTTTQAGDEVARQILTAAV